MNVSVGIGLAVDFLWCVASLVFWTMLFISVYKERKLGDDSHKKSRDKIEVIAVIVGMIAFFIGLFITAPEYTTTLPLYTILELIAFGLVSVFIGLLYYCKQGIVSMIVLFSIFALITTAIVLRAITFYIPSLLAI